MLTLTTIPYGSVGFAIVCSNIHGQGSLIYTHGISSSVYRQSNTGVYTQGLYKQKLSSSALLILLMNIGALIELPALNTLSANSVMLDEHEINFDFRKFTQQESHKSIETYSPSFKGTNGRQKTYEIFHVYSIFYSGSMCQTTVILGITKDGSLVLNTLAS